MANGQSSPMERVKMLNMREETMLRKELENIHVLEKKKLHLLNKDTINLRMELRAHRFRAMKTAVRQKGALQEFDEKWKQRAQSRMDPRAKGEFIIGAHPEVRESYINHMRSARHSAGARNVQAEDDNSTSQLKVGLSKSSEAFYPRPPTSQRPHTPLQRRSAQIKFQQDSTKGNPQISTDKSPGFQTRSSPSSSRETPLSKSPTLETSQARRQSILSRNSRSPSLLSTASQKPPDLASAASSNRRRSSVINPRSRRRSTQVNQHAGGNAYLTRLVQSIAGGSSGAKVAGEKDGKDPGSLLDKLKTHRFDQFTDGSLAMEMRKLRQKKMSVHTGDYVPKPDDLLPPSQRGANTSHRPTPPRTAPPEGRRKQVGATVVHAWRRQATVLPHVVKRKRTYDSEEALAEDNEGLLRLHREGQRQEYEEVLRRVNRFLGKPLKSECVLHRDDLTREELLLLNKVRPPPKTRLKGAVKLVIFLNKAKGLSLLGMRKPSNDVKMKGNSSETQPLSSAVQQPAPARPLLKRLQSAYA